MWRDQIGGDNQAESQINKVSETLYVVASGLSQRSNCDSYRGESGSGVDQSERIKTGQNTSYRPKTPARLWQINILNITM